MCVGSQNSLDVALAEFGLPEGLWRGLPRASKCHCHFGINFVILNLEFSADIASGRN